MIPARVIALALMLFGLVLHTFTWTAMASSFSVSYWLLSLSPYIASVVLYFASRKPHAAAGALVLSAILDVGAFYYVFVDPQSSMAGLALFFVPIWNLLLFVPIGASIGWWVGRRIPANTDVRAANLDR